MVNFVCLVCINTCVCERGAHVFCSVNKENSWPTFIGHLFKKKKKENFKGHLLCLLSGFIFLNSVDWLRRNFYFYIYYLSDTTFYIFYSE